ncbi:MAG TPA: type VI secretion system protein TssA [Bryobacteraceae bacterium]
MADRVYFSDELLQPISAESPSGRDMRYEPLFTQILEARRADDNLSQGAWEKEEGRKAAQWDRVSELALGALKANTKDLRVACFLAEAAIHLDGFAGLRDCLRLIKELLYRFWDQGLFPAVESGDLDYRASSLTWLNDRMPEVLQQQVPITARDGREANYSFARYLRAREIGREDAIARLSDNERERITGLRQQGWITLDAFDAAMRATKRAALESLYKSFEECYEQFLALEKIVDERFGQAAPAFSLAKENFEEMRRVLNQALKRKREEEPDVVPGPEERKAPKGILPGFWTEGMPSDTSGSWQEAENLVRAGNVDRGLQQMAALAAQETSGRARFVRKLMLVDVCRNADRERLARTVLEELTKQIADYKLEHWESSALVGAVWSRLYRIYKKSEMSSEQDQAVVLYNQLCRLDPWQAYLDCED